MKRPRAIINGTVIDPASGTDAKLNLYFEDGKITEISSGDVEISEDVFDAEGLYVLPGFIDLHTHLREPGFEYKEDIESGSKAARAGGFTTILCMPNTNPVNDYVDVTKRIMDRAKSVGLVNILPVGAMTVGLKGQQLADYDGMIREGIVAISDDGSCIQDDRILKEAYHAANEYGLLVISHPEIFSKSAGGHINEGEVSTKLHIAGIPRSAENDAIDRDIDFAEKTGARLHIAHVSTKEGIASVRKAKLSGLQVTCEVTPHHLLLTENDIERLGGNAKMNPPLRTEADRLALIDGLKDGTVDAIATDHAPHAPEEKGDIEKSAFGIIGMETAFPVCMKLVDDGHVSFIRLVELFTSGPARVIGRDVGNIALGVPADICIVDATCEHLISNEFQSKSSNCPFTGWNVRCVIKDAIVGGRL